MRPHTILGKPVTHFIVSLLGAGARRVGEARKLAGLCSACGMWDILGVVRYGKQHVLA